MWKSLLAAGLLAASLALTACTEPRVTNAELERATDAELARHMAVACYDWEAAWARTQAPHMSFERAVREMQPHFDTLLRVNVPLQRMRTYTMDFIAFRDSAKLRQACRLADDYTPGASTPDATPAQHVNSAMR
jgi:hypothetical protein